jgi:hypothetical protein
MKVGRPQLHNGLRSEGGIRYTVAGLNRSSQVQETGNDTVR